MRYARAIREGIGSTLKAYGRFVEFSEDGKQTITHLCVQGAALRAIGQLDFSEYSTKNQHNVVMAFPWVIRSVPGPLVPEFIAGLPWRRPFHEKQPEVSLLDASIWMNNDSRMSREEIADWIEEVEAVFLGPETEEVGR